MTVSALATPNDLASNSAAAAPSPSLSDKTWVPAPQSGSTLAPLPPAQCTGTKRQSPSTIPPKRKLLFLQAMRTKRINRRLRVVPERLVQVRLRILVETQTPKLPHLLVVLLLQATESGTSQLSHLLH